MIGTLFNGFDVLYHRAKFGEDRITRAGCRCENVVFVCFFLSRYESVALCVRGVNFEQALCHNLCVDFHSVFIGFPK